MTIRVSGGGGSVATTGFPNIVIASGGTLTLGGSTGKAYFEWVDPDTLLLKVLSATAHVWQGDYVAPGDTGIPMGLPFAITYPE